MEYADMNQGGTDAVGAVDEARQWGRLMELARLGAIPGDGVNRQALTRLDREARRLMAGWAEAAGASVTVDAAANLWLRREGTDPAAAPVVTGSHMDSQPAGGRFDGIYGVVAGLEVLSALHQSGAVTRRPIEVVGWTNEEGSRFAPGCMGSMAWSGFKPVEAFAGIADRDGIRFGDALAEHLAAEHDIPRRAMPDPAQGDGPHAYVEAHIEQGPKLEAEDLDIGVVVGIQGSRWFDVTLRGESAHAGTTPVSLRRDAVQDMLRVLTALNGLMHDPTDVLRYTVGRVTVSPNSSNSVADTASFSIDLRHPDEAVLAARANAVLGVAQSAARVTTVTVEETFAAPPILFDASVIDAVARAAGALRYRHVRMPSGAFHDAQFVARVAPTGMIFVPSRRGISHNPAEYTAPDQLAAGTRVLARTLIELAA